MISHDGLAPVTVAELWELDADGRPATMVRYDPLRTVAPGAHHRLPKSEWLTDETEASILVFTLDGFGHERQTRFFLASLPSLRPAAAPTARFPCVHASPPAPQPLEITVEPSPTLGCRGAECQARLLLHNPMPTPIRLDEVWIHQPGGETSSPARHDDRPVMVPAHATTPVPRHGSFPTVGTYRLEVTAWDGWGRPLRGETTTTVAPPR